MTYTEACKSLFTMVENAMFEYECECAILEEDANPAAGEKAKAILGKIWAGIKKLGEIMLNAIKAACKWVAAKIGDRGGAALVANQDFEIRKYTADVVAAGTLKEIQKCVDRISSYKLGTDDSETIEATFVALDDILKKTNSEMVTIKAGDKLKSSDHYLKILKKSYAYMNTANEKINGIEKAIGSSENKETDVENAKNIMEVLKLCKGFIDIINKDIHTIFVNSGSDARFGKNAKAELKIKGRGVQAESVEGDSISALRARCLIEAASILKEAADDAYVKVDPAQQKDVENIPEEKPVEAPEYPEDTSGGEGIPEDFLEDTKDLVDDDKKAMDLLTDDEDKSLTIEESVNLLLDL